MVHFDQERKEQAKPVDVIKAMKDMQDMAKQSSITAQTLYPNIQFRLTSLAHYTLAGRIIDRMNAAQKPNGEPFTNDDINDVVMALCAKDEEEKEPSFILFARHNNMIDAEDFKNVVPLLRENLKSSEVQAMFSKADKDGSGQIDFPEYCAFLTGLQMADGPHARKVVLARERAETYKAPRVAKFPDLGKDLGPAIKTMMTGGHVDTGTVYHLLKKLFEDADIDDSGTLDKMELGEVLKAYYRLEGISRNLDVVQREIDGVMGKYDTDKSGALDLIEFVRMFCDSNKDAVFASSIPRDVLNKVAKLAERMRSTTRSKSPGSPSSPDPFADDTKDKASPSGEVAEA